ncbi:hypothetical protein [Pseudoxanthomonas mexicana]
MAAKKKPKPAERARIAYRFEDGSTLSQPLVETALARIRQWVAIEKMDANTPEEVQGRASARANLRKVAELAINAELGLFTVTEGGRKGGKGGSNSKAAAILAEADKRATIGTGEIQAIANRTGATVRTVRDTLRKAGQYTPQKNGK